MAPTLTERARRIWAATEARAVGRGGITLVARATGIGYSTIARGVKELASRAPMQPPRIRRSGGGRKTTLEKDPTLLIDLEGLVELTASGDPMAPLRWTSKSVRQLTGALQAMGHPISRQRVAELLAAAGYNRRANRKTREGPNRPDGDVQFRYINQHVRRFQRTAQPVISVDVKKKEVVGDFKNAGREWRPTGRPKPVGVHDFLIPERAEVIPDGVYDLTPNAGWVSVGIDHDTASCVARTIGRWWQKMGRPVYRRARSVLITADADGSSGARGRLWKWELQQLANRTRLALTVCHFPPGTSKWNKVEHRLISYSSTNWRGQPLVSLAAIVNLIGSTRATAGRRVRCELDRGTYPKGREVSDAEMATLKLVPHRVHGDWNYTIHPQRCRRLSSVRKRQR